MMGNKRGAWWAALAVLAGATALYGDTDPMSFTAEWHPVVGAGGEYEVQVGAGPKVVWQMAVVGQERDGYWVEVQVPDGGGTTMKTLVAAGAVKQVIVKIAGQPAMEMPANFVTDTPGTNIKETGRLVGRERISTSAGSFDCGHYQVTKDNGTADVWVAEEVSPYGLVKMVSPELTMTLDRVLTRATTRITETPQQMQMPPAMAGMMQQMRGMASGDQGVDPQALQQMNIPGMLQQMQGGMGAQGAQSNGTVPQDISNLLQQQHR